uniref:RING-type E3 ubiquitin transferase n=1 Tax=Anthurium amnicola TaxID=1678845 RepID=A0A1D1Z1F6_9ARAE
MSSRDQTAATVVATVATAFDGAIAGLTLAFVAAKSWAKYLRSSSSLAKVRSAPSAHISDLRSILSSDEDPAAAGPSSPAGEKLVVVRGEVQTRWPAGSKSNGALVSQGSGERAVIVQRTSTCLYSEWRGIFGWRIDLHALFAKTWREQHSRSLRTVPFILVEDGPWPHRGFINVKLEGSKHPLPLTTVYHHLLPVQATTYTFFQAILGHGYPVALLDEEKILPVGKEITAIGLCSLHDGVLEIKPSDELPCFLSDMTKGEMEADLAANVNVLFWSGILLGVLSMGILCYATRRNWRRLKEWKNRRQLDRETATTSAETSADDESGDIPDGELCVICLMRRRRCVFIPCGHRVCCVPCAAAVKRDPSPRCPLCRQNTQNFVRVFDS